MKFSLEWLRDHVDIDVETAALADRLTTVGFAVEGIEKVGEDTVLDVEVTSNRPDCMNHRGLAREIAAALGRPLRPLPPAPAGSARSVSDVTRVDIEAPELCSRYTARVVLGVRLGPSPAWLERRLRAIGLTSNWNVVDAANYVLWDLGHPLHTFDMDHLDERRIVVRRAREGEHMVTVADGLDHALDPSMLLIADASRGVAVAGVMGGLDSGISEKTRDVLIESAWFDPISIRRTARALGMHTDASHRFERGADPSFTLRAADELCRRILEVAGGECLAGAVDAIGRDHPTRRIFLRRGRVGDLLGMRVADGEVETRLGALGIELEKAGEDRDGWQATLPDHRSDLSIEEDLIEEVARSIGYDAFPSTLPTATTLPPERLERDDPEILVRETLVSHGYSETIGYAMVGRGEDEIFAPVGALPAVTISNPLSERWEVMRRCILPGLARTAAHNLRHGRRDLALFEVGTIFHANAGGSTDAARGGSDTEGSGAPDASVGPDAAEVARLPREERVVGLVACGRAEGVRWDLPKRDADLFDTTAAIEAIVRAREPVLAPGRLRFVPAGRPYLHRDQSFSVLLDGDEIGFGGILDPGLAGRIELAALAPRAVVAQVSLTALAARRPEAPRFRPIPRFPASSRDLSVVVSDATPWAQVERVARRALEGAPASLTLTDRYTGAPLPPDRVSLTLGILIEPEDRTWTMEEIDALLTRLIAALRDELGAEIRS